MHFRFSCNCHTCTTGEHNHFCSRNMDFGNSTRFTIYVSLFLLLLFFPLYLYTCTPLLLLFANMFLYVDWWYFFCYISAFLLYVGSVVVVVFVLVFHLAPRYGHSNVLIFTGICSLMGSLSVFSLHCLYFLVTWMSCYSLYSHPDFFSVCKMRFKHLGFKSMYLLCFGCCHAGNEC